MIPLGKPNPFSTWAVEVEVGVSSSTSQDWPDTTSRQDNGSCSRLPTLPGCRRRSRPYAIYVSDFKRTSPMNDLNNIFISEMPENCR